MNQVVFNQFNTNKLLYKVQVQTNIVSIHIHTQEQQL
jgi:hypothetical protein